MDLKKKRFEAEFLERVKKPVRRSVPLKPYSHFRIGGRADYFFEALTPEDMKSSVLIAREYGLPYYVIGGGSNILFDDRGFRGLIIKNALCSPPPERSGDTIAAPSGMTLQDLVNLAIREGLAGLAFLAGIPGTVGGAVCGNAGAFGEWIGDRIQQALLLLPDGREIIVKREYFEFSYRDSILKRNRSILLQAAFQLGEGNREVLNEEMKDYLRKRRHRHPPHDVASAGCFFKNPVLPDGTKAAAGLLLEKIGALGLRVGDAAVFPGHANFIVNLGKAKSRDVLTLARSLKDRVEEKFGVKLQEEVIFLPADFEAP